MLSAIFKKEQAAEAAPESASTGLWQLAMRRLKRDRIAMFSLYVVLFYLLLLVLSMPIQTSLHQNFVVQESEGFPQEVHFYHHQLSIHMGQLSHPLETATNATKPYPPKP